MPIPFVNAKPNRDSREKGLAPSAVRSHTTKLVTQKKKEKSASLFKKATLTTRMG